MKLLVILLCIASERYLVHAASLHRYQIFSSWFHALTNRLPRAGFFTNPYVVLACVILPALIVASVILAFTDNILYGFIGFLLNVLVFYFCMGPDNSFYPVSQSEDGREEPVENYFYVVNSQLFAVIFWFIVTGPIGVLCYRLLYVCAEQELTGSAAKKLTDFLDWVTVRMTLLLYLLVGNFQRGFQYFTQVVLSAPENNAELLKKGGILAAQTGEEETISLPHAQNLVEHALVIFLVFLAFFTLVAWL